MTFSNIFLDGVAGRRPSMDRMFMGIAHVAACRSTCDRGPDNPLSPHKGVGSVIVTPDLRQLSIGYSGSPPKHAHCDDVGHLMHNGSCIRTLHAEENAIINSPFSTKECIIYVTAYPCYNCAKRIVSAGIVKVFYANEYVSQSGPDPRFVFSASGIKLIKLEFKSGDV